MHVRQSSVCFGFLTSGGAVVALVNENVIYLATVSCFGHDQLSVDPPV